MRPSRASRESAWPAKSGDLGSEGGLEEADVATEGDAGAGGQGVWPVRGQAMPAVTRCVVETGAVGGTVIHNRDVPFFQRQGCVFDGKELGVVAQAEPHCGPAFADLGLGGSADDNRPVKNNAVAVKEHQHTEGWSLTFHHKNAGLIHRDAAGATEPGPRIVQMVPGTHEAVDGGHLMLSGFGHR